MFSENGRRLQVFIGLGKCYRGGPERIIFLRQVAESHYKKGGQHFGGSGVPVEYIHKQFQENIIEQEAAQHYGKIFGELLPFPGAGFLEYHVPAQVKTRGKSHGKADQESGNMRPYGNKRQVHRLLLQDEIVGNEKKADIQQGIGPPAGCVTECLQGHEPFKQGIESIHDPEDQLLYVCMQFAHSLCEGSRN